MATAGQGWNEPPAAELTAAQKAAMAHVGPSQAEFTEKIKAKYAELMETGQVEPYTVVNFNPPALTLEGELGRYKVPSPLDERLPKNVMRIAFDWDGRERVGHALTIAEPHMYGRMAGAKAKDGNLAQAIPEREAAYYLPSAIAYAFLEHYSPIFVTARDKKTTAPPKDRQRLYGVLAFKGDLHTLDKALKQMRQELALEGAGHDLSARPVTERAHLQIPVAQLLTVGKTHSRIYRAVPFPLIDYLRKMFSGQLEHAKLVLARAQQKWSETQTVKDISESDRMWYRWAIRLGYAKPPKEGERSWLNELVSVEGMDLGGASGGGQERRKCQACRTLEPEAGTPFCPKCGAPVETGATFWAGFPVADAWLDSWLAQLEGDDHDRALAELARRKKSRSKRAAKTPHAAATAEAGDDEELLEEE